MWIDPPLGPPWYKHACFESTTLLDAKSTLAVEYKLSIQNPGQETEPNLIIGIVKSTRVDILKRFTDIDFETGKQESQNIRLKHNAGFLLGKLCVHDITNEEMWPIEEPSYIFAIYKPPELPETGVLNCPKCGVKLNARNLNKHLRRQHGIS